MNEIAVKNWLILDIQSLYDYENKSKTSILTVTDFDIDLQIRLQLKSDGGAIRVCETTRLLTNQTLILQARENFIYLYICPK